MLERKKSLYKKAKKWGRVNDWTEYCALNNSLKKACNSARRQHIHNIAQDLQINGNPKSFWSYVNSIRKGTNDLVALKENNTTLTDDLSIAENMNSYFSTVFTSESFTNFSVFKIVVNSRLSSIICNTNEVLHILKNLNAYKSPGPDHLSPRVLKECAVEIAPSLCKLVNALFATGSVPYAWKQADIVPIHKKGPKTDRENYRQISLTSIACKVCEKIVKKRVINFWQSLGIFNPIQFGFLEGKSTMTQLLTCYNDWASSRNKSTPTDVVFLDFTKAFDSVPHKRLLLKLKGYGIEGNLLHWFRNFLTNRQQRVVDPCQIRSTPVNNPWAHFIYVNDISSNISSSIKMFADDTNVYREITDLDNDTRALQTDIVRLVDWATLCQLRFNPGKCETMHITHSRDRSVPSYIMGSRITPVKYTKDL